MDISNLLTAFNLARGEQGQQEIALPSGAEFAASLGACDATLPVASPKVQAPKAGVSDGLLALIAPPDFTLQDDKIDLPVSWQAIQSDAENSPNPSAKAAPDPDDTCSVDAAMAYCLAPLPPPQPDPEPKGAAEGSFAQMTSQVLVAPPDLPQLQAPISSQAVAKGSLTDFASSDTAQPFPAAGDRPFLPLQPDPYPMTPQGPGNEVYDLPLLTDSGFFGGGPGQAKLTATLGRAVPGQGDSGQNTGDLRVAQDLVSDSLDKAHSLDVSSLTPQAPQAAASQSDTEDPRLQKLGQGWAAQVSSPVIEGAGLQGIGLQSKTSAHVDPDPDPEPKPLATGKEEKTKQGDQGLGPLSAPQGRVSDPFPLSCAQAMPDLAQSPLKAGQGAARLAVKPDPALRAADASAVAVHPKAAPVDTRRAEVGPSFELRLFAPEVQVKEGDSPTDPAKTPANLGFSLAFLSNGAAIMQPLAQALTQSAQVPKMDLGLHHLPAVIEHLHQDAARHGHSHAEVLMNPAELGRIRFDMITQGDQVQVTLSVERPETLDLLRANAEALRQEFRTAGLTADTLNFGQWAQRSPPREQAESPQQQANPVAAPLALAAPYVKPVSSTGLDLRL